MTRIPRDLSGEALARALAQLGYAVVRRHGSHARLTTQRQGEHGVTISWHDQLRVGTLAGILTDVADHFQMSCDDIIERLFG